MAHRDRARVEHRLERFHRGMAGESVERRPGGLHAFESNDVHPRAVVSSEQVTSHETFLLGEERGLRLVRGLEESALVRSLHQAELRNLHDHRWAPPTDDLPSVRPDRLNEGTQEVSVEVVDVRSGQLRQVEVAEMRLEMALDDGADMAHGGSRRARGRGLDPLVEQVGERASPDPSAARLGDQLLELLASEPTGAIDGLAEPSLPPRRRIGAEVDAELPSATWRSWVAHVHRDAPSPRAFLSAMNPPV
jgi:hypothetical protein